jgi:DNA-binding GntR family transcriptional regulator
MARRVARPERESYREREEISPSVDNWRLRSVERASTTEQVLMELRDAIIDGRIPQGEQLREAPLAQELGTGRSAVREAIRHLVQEGLVDHEMHRGAIVRVVSLADRLDVYRAREVIEAGAVRQLLDGDDPVDLSPLRAALDALRRAVPPQGRVTEEAIVADIRFHRELVDLCGISRLSRAHQTLAAETRMLLRHHPVYPATDYVGDHERLLDALERRDPRTPDLVAEHLRLSARLIGDELAREASGNGPAA